MDEITRLVDSLPIEVLLSGAGYYIGQLEDGAPWSRLSAGYYPTREAAEQALRDGTFDDRRLYAVEFQGWRLTHGFPEPSGPR